MSVNRGEKERKKNKRGAGKEEEKEGREVILHNES